MRYWVFSLVVFLSLAASADNLRERVQKIAHQEWEFFGRQQIDIDGKLVRKGGQEAEEGFYKRVGTYWKEGCNIDLTGKDTHEPWSAAFISYVMRKAGLGERFSYSDWHATYIRNSIRYRKANDPNFAFWGYRLEERAPQVGDLVGYARQDGIDFDYQPVVYKSHTDSVVAVRPGEIDVIGGNVSDSVTLKTLKTDKEGKLIDRHYRWFVVMEPNF